MKIWFKNANTCEFPSTLEMFTSFEEEFDENVPKFCEWSGAKDYLSDISRQELSNEYLVAKIGFDTEGNEP